MLLAAPHCSPPPPTAQSPIAATNCGKIDSLDEVNFSLDGLRRGQRVRVRTSVARFIDAASSKIKGSPATRWASVAFGAGAGLGSAYSDCSRLFDKPTANLRPSNISEAPVSQDVQE